jgi:hypothetical protein
MNELQASVVMIALFALRCVLPLALTIAAVHLMNRVLARWEAAESAARPGPVLAATPSAPPAAAAPSISLACWLLNNCSEEERVRCAAYRRQDIPCWQARLIEEGILPERCAACPRYTALQGAV